MRAITDNTQLITLTLSAAPTSPVEYTGEYWVSGTDEKIGIAGTIATTAEENIVQSYRNRRFPPGRVTQLTIANPSGNSAATVTVKWQDAGPEPDEVVTATLHRAVIAANGSAKYTEETGWQLFSAGGRAGGDLDKNDNALIAFGDSPSIDAFARLRVSDPYTVFDSKMLWDKAPEFWDEELTGTPTPTSAHDSGEASVTMDVDTSGQAVVRQTFMRFGYQPGKSQLVFLTGVLGAGVTNVTRRIGAFSGDETATATASDNGLFFELDDSTLSVVVRNAGTDTAVAQSAWNLDKMDGTGPSGVTVDTSKAQIFVIDFEWLGVGRVRFGFVINGLVVYCHQVLHVNSVTAVYMGTPNLPLRYELSSTGGTGSLVQICSSVMSEGGQQHMGALRTKANAALASMVASNTYAAVGLRLKTTHLDAIVEIVRANALFSAAQDMRWSLVMNPTLGAALSWSDITNSPLQGAIGGSSHTISAGTDLAGGYVRRNTTADNVLPGSRRIGAAIDGTRDVIVLALESFGNGTGRAELGWREVL